MLTTQCGKCPFKMADFAQCLLLFLLPLLSLLEGLLCQGEGRRGGLFACQKHIKIIGNNDNFAKLQNIFKLTESNRRLLPRNSIATNHQIELELQTQTNHFNLLLFISGDQMMISVCLRVGKTHKMKNK